jgi:hypothetical protein
MPDVAAEKRCECCDLPEGMCGKAVERRQRAEAARIRQVIEQHPATFPAQYDGACAACDEPFKVGDSIMRGRGGWISAGCVAEALGL